MGAVAEVDMAEEAAVDMDVAVEAADLDVAEDAGEDMEADMGVAEITVIIIITVETKGTTGR